MKVSIIIRTYNEETYLRGLFRNIRNQTQVMKPFDGYETIVVDSGSTDKTLEIAKRFATKIVHIDRERFTFGRSLNMGIEASDGSHIAIISAHCKIKTDHWLAWLLFPFFRDDNVAMVYGKQRGCITSKFSDVTDLLLKYGNTPNQLGFFSNNANSALGRTFWEHHKFNEELPGLEDIEWARFWFRQGYNIVYEPSAVVQHCHSDTWKQVRNRLCRETIAARQLGLDMYGYKDILKELGLCFADLPVTPDITETVLFRFNKVLGMLKGRTK